jgi:hypothetical protein
MAIPGTGFTERRVVAVPISPAPRKIRPEKPGAFSVHHKATVLLN